MSRFHLRLPASVPLVWKCVEYRYSFFPLPYQLALVYGWWNPVISPLFPSHRCLNSLNRSGHSVLVWWTHAGNQRVDDLSPHSQVLRQAASKPQSDTEFSEEATMGVPKISGLPQRFGGNNVNPGTKNKTAERTLEILFLEQQHSQNTKSSSDFHANPKWQKFEVGALWSDTAWAHEHMLLVLSLQVLLFWLTLEKSFLHRQYRRLHQKFQDPTIDKLHKFHGSPNP